jgi:hypothetical protein
MPRMIAIRTKGRYGHRNCQLKAVACGGEALGTRKPISEAEPKAYNERQVEDDDEVYD